MHRVDGALLIERRLMALKGSGPSSLRMSRGFFQKSRRQKRQPDEAKTGAPGLMPV